MDMKKIVTFGVLAATALTLAACKGNTEEAPAAEATAEATEAAPDAMATDDAAALEAAAGAAEGTDTNSNPIRPAAGAEPAASEAAPAE
jgi:hypothetical protein